MGEQPCGEGVLRERGGMGRPAHDSSGARRRAPHAATVGRQPSVPAVPCAGAHLQLPRLLVVADRVLQRAHLLVRLRGRSAARRSAAVGTSTGKHSAAQRWVHQPASAAQRQPLQAAAPGGAAPAQHPGAGPSTPAVLRWGSTSAARPTPTRAWPSPARAARRPWRSQRPARSPARRRPARQSRSPAKRCSRRCRVARRRWRRRGRCRRSGP